MRQLSQKESGRMRMTGSQGVKMRHISNLLELVKKFICKCGQCQVMAIAISTYLHVQAYGIQECWIRETTNAKLQFHTGNSC